MKKVILWIALAVTMIVGNVSPALADAIAYDMEPANYYVYVMTPDGGLNFRCGPGVEYDKVIEGRIPDYTKLYIEYTSGNWGYTVYEGNYGWVALKQTITTPPAQQQAVAEPTPKSTEKAVATETVLNEALEATEKVTEVATEAPAKAAMTKEIVLIGSIVVLMAVIAVLLVVIINQNSGKNKR